MASDSASSLLASFGFSDSMIDDLPLPPPPADLPSVTAFLSTIQTYSDWKSKDLKYLRQQIGRLGSFLDRDKFQGMSEEEYSKMVYERKSEKVLKQKQKAANLKHIETTKLRSGRIEALNSLIKKDDDGSGQLQYLVPDGVGDEDRAGAVPMIGDGEPAVNLTKPRSCYTCKARFTTLHHFYDQLCPPCSTLNYTKRFQTANLKDKICVVTGGRVKIGYRVVLKLLRSGGTVVVTTRFPKSAENVYKSDPDYSTWISENRLHVFGLDLRDLVEVERFCKFVIEKFKRVDVLINNACQTVRRGAKFYENKVDEEAKSEGGEGVKLFEHFEETREKIQGNGFKTIESESNGFDVSSSLARADNKISTLNVSRSAAMSLLPLTPNDTTRDSLPTGLTDINGQQLDLSKTNSWLLKLGEVQTPEIVECMFINVISPFILNGRLLPYMGKNSFIVNVSAMEGKFYRFKTENHPHTNMAKAALNMMTRTSAESLASRGVFMNSVDTGWINDENPREKAAKTKVVNNFQTPIDEIDAAARILDTVMVGVKEGWGVEEGVEGIQGKFLKDYVESEW
ncbi:hypothetical protein TL16_g09485 [Triparma laevis f. inornata]|uniref:Oxidoreductase n=2 Tax=Triparma laevis TaxID=1534972 RepID=A0A9W7EIK7_9STRA|nr:hypothetical protein TrLO_g14975 [Triparma laevis f. longispina]GMH83103.1 hypothetical protein TL16_g09485 [Triparma laevis f. inornata]